MENDSIKWGKLLTRRIAGQDADGAYFAITAEWAGAWRIVTQLPEGGDLPDGGDLDDGAQIAAGALDIADGLASFTVDTSAAGWAPGHYYYDVRLTDPDGVDWWSDIVHLELLPRITAPS